MNLPEHDVERSMAKVLKRLKRVDAPQSRSGDFGLFASLDEAVSAAAGACKKIPSLALRNRVISAIRKAGVEHARMLAELAVQETGMGRIADKVAKNILQAEHTPGAEVLVPRALSGDAGLALEENAPWGVIASVTPSTNPAATIINNSISMIAAGNAVVFAPHPGAKKTSQTAIQLLNRAIHESTGIADLLCSVREPSIEAAQRLFAHKDVKLLVVTGGEAVVDAARKHAAMRLIAAGAGNPPVVVDESADIKRAARGIYGGASFDNNIICADEKEIVAVDSIADQLKQEMKALGTFEISLEQADAIARFALRGHPGPVASANPKWVGRDAALIAREAGFSVPESCRLLLVDVARDIEHVFARTEQMIPVIPLLRAKDIDEAIDWAFLLERGLCHTAGIHSRNIDNMHSMALRMNTSLFVKNGPHIAALGVGGEGWTSMTISTPTGEGVTSARSFVRIRRCVLVDNFRIV
jgi:aldehyde dehydrogenase